MTTTLLEELAHERALDSDTGAIEGRGIRITWTAGREIAVEFEATSPLRFTPPNTGRVQLSRSEAEDISLWSWVRKRTRPALHAELRNAQGSVRLAATVDDPAVLEGLPEVDARGVSVPLPALMELLRAAALLEMSFAQVPKGPEQKMPRASPDAEEMKEKQSIGLFIVVVVTIVVVIVIFVLIRSGGDEDTAQNDPLVSLPESTRAAEPQKKKPWLPMPDVSIEPKPLPPVCERAFNADHTKLIDLKSFHVAREAKELPTLLLESRVFDSRDSSTCQSLFAFDPATAERVFELREALDAQAHADSFSVIGVGNHHIWRRSNARIELRDPRDGSVVLDHDALLMASPILRNVLNASALQNHVMKVDPDTGELLLLGLDARWYRIAEDGTSTTEDEMQTAKSQKVIEQRCQWGPVLHEGHSFSRLMGPSGRRYALEGEPRKRLSIALPTTHTYDDFDDHTQETFFDPRLIVRPHDCLPVEVELEPGRPAVLIVHREAFGAREWLVSLVSASGEVLWTHTQTPDASPSSYIAYRDMEWGQAERLTQAAHVYVHRELHLKQRFNAHLQSGTVAIWGTVDSGHMLEVLDAATGDVLWTYRGLPPNGTRGGPRVYGEPSSGGTTDVSLDVDVTP